MADHQASLADLEAQVARRETRVFVRTLLVVLIPVVVAAIWLWTTLSAISNANSELVNVQAELVGMQERVSALQLKLRDAANFDDNRHELDWSDAKAIFSRVEWASLLLSIHELQEAGVGWDLSNTPERGFHSPGFAEYVLDRSFGLSLSDLERTENQHPRPGDVVVYDTGYTMFYFRDRDGIEFVIGMTPVGIVALKYDFGPKRRYVLRNRS